MDARHSQPQRTTNAPKQGTRTLEAELRLAQGLARLRQGAASRGFTIVELLIVVVVIAILVAVAIVAYSGITKQAQSTAYAAAADTVEKQFRILVANGTRLADLLPEDEIEVRGCWGDISDYPATSDFEEGECYATSGPSVVVNPEVTSKIKAALPQLAIPKNLVTVSNGIQKQRGIFFSIIKLPGSTSYLTLSWKSPDKTGCGRSQTMQSAEEAYRPLRQLHESILAVLKDAQAGRITLLQAQAQIEAVNGESGSSESPTMAQVDETVTDIEGLLANPILYDTTIRCHWSDRF